MRERRAGVFGLFVLGLDAFAAIKSDGTLSHGVGRIMDSDWVGFGLNLNWIEL